MKIRPAAALRTGIIATATAGIVLYPIAVRQLSPRTTVSGTIVAIHANSTTRRGHWDGGTATVSLDIGGGNVIHLWYEPMQVPLNVLQPVRVTYTSWDDCIRLVHLAGQPDSEVLVVDRDPTIAFQIGIIIVATIIAILSFTYRRFAGSSAEPAVQKMKSRNR